MTGPRPGWEDRPECPLDSQSHTHLPDRSAQPDRPAASGEDAGMDPAELVRGSGVGDEAAFAALYDTTSATVYGVTVRVTRSPEIAAEVLQEVYLMAGQQAVRFDRIRGSVLGWLCTLAHRRVVDRIRQVTRQRGREQVWENRAVGTPADETWQEVEPVLDTEAVRAGVGALTLGQRKAVALAYHGGCTDQEVAQRLEVPLGTAKARIGDGLKSLRAALGVGP